MSQLKYGVIGCGMMGQEHVRNIKLIEGSDVTAVYEPDSRMRSVVSELLPDVVFYNSIAELLAQRDLDALVVASPNFLHMQQLREITAQCQLPILVEKPLATDPQDRSLVVQLRDSYPAPIWVGMEYRYMPPLSKFIEMCDEATGGIRMLTICEHRYPFLEKVDNWNRFNKYSGGTLVEKCCHFFDLMRVLTRSEPTTVMASGAQMNNHLDESYNGESSDIWDAAYAMFNFESGAKAMLELCMFADGAEYQEQISAIGPKGKIECLIPGPARFWPAHLGAMPEAKIVVSPRDQSGSRVIEVGVDDALQNAGDHHGSTFYQHLAFQQAVLGKRSAEVTLWDGWRAVEMGLAAQQSSNTGQSVSLGQ